MSKNEDTHKILLQGNEACVVGAIMAGCRFYAGYPITPATDIMEYMSRRIPLVGGTCIQMEDEISSLGAVLGASLAGVKSMTATSGPGLSLMQEHISYGCMAEIPCVIVDVMRGGPSTGLPTLPSQGDIMAIRWGAHGDHPMIALAASSVSEYLELTIQAFNYSEKYRTPVVVVVDEVIAHTRESVTLPSQETIKLVERVKPTSPPEWYVPYKDLGTGVPPMPAFGEGYRYHVTGLAHDVHGYPTTRSDEVGPLILRLFNKISRDFDKLQLFDSYYTDDAVINIIAYGSVARSSLRAVRDARAKGMKVGLIKLKVLWPFMRSTVTKYLHASKKVLVPEMNMGQISREIKRVNDAGCEVLTLNKADGSLIRPSEILRRLEEMYA